MPDQIYVHLVVPFLNWPIWEGETSRLAWQVGQMAAMFIGLAGVSAMLDLWEASRGRMGISTPPSLGV